MPGFGTTGRSIGGSFVDGATGAIRGAALGMRALGLPSPGVAPLGEDSAGVAVTGSFGRSGRDGVFEPAVVPVPRAGGAGRCWSGRSGSPFGVPVDIRALIGALTHVDRKTGASAGTTPRAVGAKSGFMNGPVVRGADAMWSAPSTESLGSFGSAGTWGLSTSEAGSWGAFGRLVSSDSECRAEEPCSPAPLGL